MLFLMFQLGKDRYVLEASKVVEVLPLLAIKKMPHAPKGVAGIFNYRGKPVPAVDLSELALGQPASPKLSTRIILLNYENDAGQRQLIGLIAEHATEIVRKERKDFVDSGMKLNQRRTGPIAMDSSGVIQWIHEQKLLPPPVRDALFAEAAEQTQ